MNNLWTDVRYALRMLAKSPVFTAVAVLTLALGIGANTAIFSVVNAVLLRPLPYPDAERLVVLKETKLPEYPQFSVSPGNFLDWQKQATAFERLESYGESSYNLTGTGDPERLRAARVTSGLFRLLAVQPGQGRDFLPEDDQPDREGVVILSAGLWMRRFGSDPHILGKTLTLSARQYTVIGVMPTTFEFPNRQTELWTPMAFDAGDRAAHGAHYISVLGRLKLGTALGQALAEMKTIAGGLEKQYPGTNTGWSVNVVPMRDYQVGQMRATLWILLGAVGLVLLIAAANVANLMLARATERHKEMAIRTALGATRWQMARQVLTESLTLSVLGGIAGLLVAFALMRWLLSLAPRGLPRLEKASIDVPVFAFTALLTLATGLFFGMVPTFQAMRANLNDALKEGGRGSTDGAHRRHLRELLVISELALALVLVVGAGLLTRSFYRLQQVDPGFKPENAVVAGISLPRSKYTQPEQQTAFFAELTNKLSALPGVQAVGGTQSLPIEDDFVLGMIVQGRPPLPPGQDQDTNYYAVTPGYFQAMGIPLLRGRLFNEFDSKDSPHVVLINQTFAKMYFPSEDPIGKRIHVTNGPEIFREIVGIVGDVRQYGLDEKVPAETYEPAAQHPFSGMSVVIRSATDLSRLGPIVRQTVLAVDKDQPVGSIRTLEEVVTNSFARQRFLLMLLSAFGVLALLLAAVGTYGVMSYMVTQRTQEVGIRMALGAQPKDVLRLVVGKGIRLGIAGVLLGLLGALAATRVLSSSLFAVSATDPVTFATVALLLAGVALLASYLPARRATRVDPLVALRYE
jgi:putative ABC transport system permease protein